LKPGTREFHEFIKGTFRKELRNAYEKFSIVSEADLQAIAWLLLRDFLREHDPVERKLKVLNKPYFKDLGIHPDLAIFRRGKPWVLIELKERRRLTVRSARKEWKRLIRAKEFLKPKRAYLVYVARWGNGKVLTGPKGPGAKFFFEVPIVLEDVWPQKRVEDWEEEFRKWSKYVTQ